MRPPFPKDDDQESVATDIIEFRPEAHSPVMFGRMVEHVEVDSQAADDFDPATSHPACVGYTMLERPPKPATPPPATPPPREKCNLFACIHLSIILSTLEIGILAFSSLFKKIIHKINQSIKLIYIAQVSIKNMFKGVFANNKNLN